MQGHRTSNYPEYKIKQTDGALSPSYTKYATQDTYLFSEKKYIMSSNSDMKNNISWIQQGYLQIGLREGNHPSNLPPFNSSLAHWGLFNGLAWLPIHTHNPPIIWNHWVIFYLRTILSNPKIEQGFSSIAWNWHQNQKKWKTKLKL